MELFKTDISDWRITFVDTGLHSAIGERLRRVRRFVKDEEMFLANYADVFTDAPLPDMISRFAASNAVVSLLAVPPQSSHHVVDVDDSGLITQVTPVRDLRQWENGGYFVLRPEIFDHLNEGEDLVGTRSSRLVPQRTGARLPVQGLLVARRHRQGTGRSWRRCTTGATAPGWSGTPSGPGSCGHLGRGSPWPTRGLRRDHAATAPRRGGRARCRCSRSARTRTTSRSRRAAPCSAWPRAIRACTSDMC